MAAMTTALTVFSYEKNKRTSTTTGHTSSDVHLVIERRVVPEGSASMAEYSFKIIQGTVDSDSAPLASNVSFEAVVRYPVAGFATDITEALARFRDIVAGDEFANSVTTQEWL